jgi:hypothetical protein
MLLSDEKHLKNLESEKHFKKRLAQTIFWCASRVDTSNPKDCLRTPELRPRIFEEVRFSAVETVAIERERYGSVEIRDAQLPKDLGGGRLLVYFPDVNLCCGTSEDETNGFFDIDNVPAWDTWVAYFASGKRSNASYLISWISPQLVEFVSRGIYVNPEECIVWLADADVSFAQDLRREGWLKAAFL